MSTIIHLIAVVSVSVFFLNENAKAETYYLKNTLSYGSIDYALLANRPCSSVLERFAFSKKVEIFKEGRDNVCRLNEDEQVFFSQSMIRDADDLYKCISKGHESKAEFTKVLGLLDIKSGAHNGSKYRLDVHYTLMKNGDPIIIVAFFENKKPYYKKYVKCYLLENALVSKIGG